MSNLIKSVKIFYDAKIISIKFIVVKYFLQSAYLIHFLKLFFKKTLNLLFHSELYKIALFNTIFDDL